MPKLLFDTRRKLNSGIGRVSQWLIDEVLKGLKNIDVHYLTTSECALEYNLPSNKSILTKFKPFSSNEFYDVPKIAFDKKFDYFFSPQFNCSSFHFCTSINIIHDLWYILNKEFIPDIDDVRFRFDNSEDYFEYVSRWLDNSRANLYLTEYGITLYNEATTCVHKYLWSQVAMISAFSSIIIFITPQLKESFELIFKRKNNLHVIQNGYNKLFKKIKLHAKKECFICLSKLEERKNLHFLLNEYCSYYDKSEIKYKLIIAGDKGYKSYNTKFLKRVNELISLGYPIEYIEDANDILLTNLFKKTRAIIVTSKYESFGLPAIEALVSKIELFSTHTGIIAKGFDKYVNFFTINNNCLTTLLLESDKRHRLKPIMPTSEIRKHVDNNLIKKQWIDLLTNEMRCNNSSWKER